MENVVRVASLRVAGYFFASQNYKDVEKIHEFSLRPFYLSFSLRENKPVTRKLATRNPQLEKTRNPQPATRFFFVLLHPVTRFVD